MLVKTMTILDDPLFLDGFFRCRKEVLYICLDVCVLMILSHLFVLHALFANFKSITLRATRELLKLAIEQLLATVTGSLSPCDLSKPELCQSEVDADQVKW